MLRHSADQVPSVSKSGLNHVNIGVCKTILNRRSLDHSMPHQHDDLSLWLVLLASRPWNLAEPVAHDESYILDQLHLFER
jgi:hypothetical protein